MLEYKNMTYQEVEKLDREKTIFLMSLSPLETHGEHLPLGTDLIVSEKLLEKYNEKLNIKYPDYKIIKLPSLALGASLLPVDGSIEIKSRNLEKLLYDFCINLNKLGFKFLILADNHGGPAHQMAVESAVYKARKKLGFKLVDPFNYFFKLMIKKDQKLLDKLNSKEGEIGDDKDLHAGNNETSLMLYLSSENVKEKFYTLDESKVLKYNGVAKLLKTVSKIFDSESLKHLAVNLAWINDENMKPYLGNPSKANKTRGQEMVEARIAIEMEYIEKIINNKNFNEKPLLWKLRFLRYFF
ncbi:MAG: creatininase family protein [Halanaerobiales bacterium]|nr:creatininase family protein [Halanaerobiales bacterium]